MVPSSLYGSLLLLLTLPLLHRFHEDVPNFLGSDGILCGWPRLLHLRSLLRYTPNALSLGIIWFLFGIDKS